ncbi:hypothetical protein Poly30_53320 [Planctomycetes bacterium Poly30]|uniref:NfeD-like C-terminal domain-containing protein n=1 Tax=Saltatorellus ferox TaxID=2528018 RepID=A0A518F0A8_9BACT|nr:hypothetical protein Poly30_53320 [Planctomycetes bacterium Poly30]
MATPLLSITTSDSGSPVLLALTSALDLSSFTAGTLYFGCAVAGGAVLSIQMLLLFLGGDVADGEVDLDGDSDGVSFFSIRAVAAFLTFFGLIGMYGQQQGWSDALTAGSALGAGVGMMLVVAWLFSMQSRLHQEGNIQPAAAVGMGATVYLRIPGENSGKGKITVALQGRTSEFAAITEGPELPTGSDVTIVRMVNETTFEVAKA